jgi:hypothetical protein
MFVETARVEITSFSMALKKTVEIETTRIEIT